MGTDVEAPSARPAPITVAVVPAAGLGTRFLPATKAVPKELFPVVDRPALQIIAEEAASSGIEELVLVTGRGKSGLLDHFDRHPELEAALERSGKGDLLRRAREPAELIEVLAVRQKQALGLGHAVLQARSLVGDRAFAVLLPDDLVQAEEPYLARLLSAWSRTGKGVVGLMEVPEDRVSSYGVVAGRPGPDGLWEIHDMVEKPAPADAPSRLAIVGRYVLPPGVFDLIERTAPGEGGEIQLTDALRTLARGEGMVGVPIGSARRHDTGHVVGYIAANVAYGLADPRFAPALREAVEELLGRRR